MVTLLSIVTCKIETSHTPNHSLHVRIQREPDQLNPILSQTSIAAAIENLLFLSVSEFDPYTQESVPVLAQSKATILKQGKNIGYKLRLKSDAIWDDGSPITSLDVLFTLKATLNPFVASGGKRSVIYAIDSVELTNDPKEFIFWTDDNYFLDEQSFTNNFIIQESMYDSSGLLRSIQWTDLKNMNETDTATATAKSALKFSERFSDPFFSREGALGAGPYKIDQWITNQSIRLKRKQNWWGTKYQDSLSSFKAYPDEIIYRIIPEESNAVIGLKDGLLDVATEISPAIFKNMADDTTYSNYINFLAGPSNRYVYLALNNKSDLLRDVATRKALARLLDLDQLKTSLFQGFAQRINAPFQPAKSYYNKELLNIPFDIPAAKDLLNTAGWLDNNKNGIVDKKIANKTKDLKLRLYTTPGGLGQKVALHLSENAKQVGIEIEILSKPLPVILEQMHAKDYEIAALADVQYPGPDDPYPVWHSKSYTEDGQNITGYTNYSIDSLIDLIRHSDPGSNRKNLYYQFQQIIYQDQPVIFLFAPQTLLAVNKKWSAQMASVRPGYFVNEFKPIVK